jgi:biopolymer transport protein ExbB
MMDLFAKGGPLMYPLLLGSVLMVAVVLERAVRFIGAGTGRRAVERIKEHIRARDIPAALRAAQEASGPVAAIILQALRYRQYTRDVIDNEISLRGDQELGRLGRNLHLLELIGKIAPMLGLLGTVMGMVEAFREVSLAQRAVDPSLLASGIWEALITTVAGLFVGIPALVFHHLFENKLKSLAFDMKHYAEEIVSMSRGVE